MKKKKSVLKKTKQTAALRLESKAIRASKFRTDMQTLNPGDVVCITNQMLSENSGVNMADLVPSKEYRFVVCPLCERSNGFDKNVMPDGTTPQNQSLVKSIHGSLAHAGELHVFHCACGLNFVVKNGGIWKVRNDAK